MPLATVIAVRPTKRAECDLNGALPCRNPPHLCIAGSEHALSYRILRQIHGFAKSFQAKVVTGSRQEHAANA
jgi:hypothetical protein